ncbi:uncharacterized protein F5Z01DRAFT_696978 [Emericellopsis atlantica]|uniref:Uncharacterized protein n=1 Tax=Emericellopsis atlantica TaxID=2614577 RepID=A0A9P7ZCS2_9HYPO|nr:uncharacterized protein F5Z01DRAFT_696978 [Emericellopsis atlantica]KAG9249699.1 hypothetical protein F5Z01DRAFT_696978 [Emericellopsis atlantica]
MRLSVLRTFYRRKVGMSSSSNDGRMSSMPWQRGVLRSTRPETPRAGSPTLTSPSRPRRQGIGMETDTAYGSEAASPQGAVRSRSPHERRSNPRRTSQRRSKNIRAYMNSGPAASIDSGSDDDANVSVRRHAKIPDDEEFHPPFLSEDGHGGSDGVEELDPPFPKRRKAYRPPVSPSRKRRRGISSLGPYALGATYPVRHHRTILLRTALAEPPVPSSGSSSCRMPR